MNIRINTFLNYVVSLPNQRVSSSLLTRYKKILIIVSVAFACLAALYYAIMHCTAKAIPQKKKFSLIPNSPSIPYPPIGQEALQFARKKLEEHPEILPYKFAAGWYAAEKTHQPVNPEIAHLTRLYWDVYYQALEEAIKKNKDDPWSKKEVIDAADNCIKIAYAISCLTLDDLPAFTENLAKKNIKRSFEEALTKQDSYLYRTFYFCTNAYHWARGGLIWRADFWNKDEEGLFYPEDGVSLNHANPYYENGTIQNRWNQLYNDYCDRIRKYVDESKLKEKDNRHINWTQKDTKDQKYFSKPDTQPT
jgi:hypothetical protein